MGKYGDFWSYVDKTEDGCWLWNGATNQQGYGICRYEGKAQRAHRVVYTKVVGEIPDGLFLDHLCRIPSCVNPTHLEPVTNKENLLRGEVGRKNKERILSNTTCAHGHLYDRVVTRSDGRQERTCSTCQRESNRRYREKRRKE